jgi:uncharacterized protein
MKPFITVLVLLSLCTSNTQGQGKLSPRQLEAYRQHFRDSLPRPTGWTTDLAGLFTHAQRHSLDSLIGNYEKKTSLEIAIVTLDTLCFAKKNLDNLTLHIANTWGIGKKDKNNGITICIAAGYHVIRVENGLGITEMLTDAETKYIIDHDMTPLFKQGDYYGGTAAGLNAIMAKLDAAMKP